MFITVRRGVAPMRHVDGSPSPAPALTGGGGGGGGEVARGAGAKVRGMVYIYGPVRDIM